MLLACLAALVAQRGTASPPAPPTLAATLPPQAYVLHRLAGPDVEVVTLIPAGAEEETYAPPPSTALALERASLYFAVGVPGLAAEGALLPALRRRRPELRVVTLAEAAPRDAGVALDDPHLWMSPAAMLAAVDALAPELARLLPERAAAIARHRDELRAEVVRLTARRAARPATFVAYHPTFGYFAAELGLRQIGVESEGKELGLGGLVRLVDEARRAGVHVLLVPPGGTEHGARVLAESIGARVVTVEPLTEDWLATLRTLAEALLGEGAA